MIERIDTRSNVLSTKTLAMAATAVVAAMAFLMGGLALQNANAVSGTLNQSVCETDIGGSWSTDTCTITSQVIISPGETLTIPQGTTFVVATTSGDGVRNNGTIINQGTTRVENTGGLGIRNMEEGLVNNTDSGTLVIANSGSFSIGIQNDMGTTSIVNYGTISVQNGGSGETTGIGSSRGSPSIYNYGTINVNSSGTATSETIGISNHFNSHFINTGTINLDNTGNSAGLLNNEFISNSGTINANSNSAYALGNNEKIVNTGTIIINGFSFTRGDFTNDGQIQINAGATFKSGGTTGSILKNGNTGTISNNGFFVIITPGSVTNDGNIINHAGGEIDNSATIDNTFGSIVNECGGIINNAGTISGNAVVNQTCDTQDPETTITNVFDAKGNKLVAKGKTIPSTTSTGVKVFVGGNDNIGVTKFECKVDNSAWTLATIQADGTAFCQYSNLKAGLTHTVSVRAYDAAGNFDHTPATFTWKINPPKLK